ncbi:MAG TPA: hypothetical protein VFG54_21445 [Prolixibacteraceae bacterium]|nr:hypothetical protein [Prolixibacteraceae bacterium]
MKPKKFIIIIATILFLSGCSEFFMICSLNPFYIEKNIVLSTEIEGNWTAKTIHVKSDTYKDVNIWELADTTSLWQIKQFISEQTIKTKGGKDSTVFRPQNYYIVKLIDNHPDSAQYQFKLVLFRAKDKLYGDFSPYETKAIENSTMASENYFTVHTLARINVKNKQFNVSWLGADYVKDMIEKKRVRIKYRYIQDAKRLLLTASSDELTQMIERYADQTRFIDWQDQPAMLKLTRIN